MGKKVNANRDPERARSVSLWFSVTFAPSVLSLSELSVPNSWTSMSLQRAQCVGRCFAALWNTAHLGPNPAVERQQKLLNYHKQSKSMG